MGQRKSFHRPDRNHHHSESRYCNHNCEVDKCDKCREQGALVEKVVCSKNVLTSAEFALPFALEAGTPGSVIYDFIAGLPLPAGLTVEVVPNYAGIKQEATALKDAVMIFGNIPATINVTATTPIPGLLPLRIPIQIFFQEISECPGACPGDHVVTSKPVIEKTLNQPLIGTGPNGGLVINLLLFKAVIRTHVTLVCTGIERDGKFHDLEPHRCDPHNVPRTINTPYEIVPNTSPLIPPSL